MSKYISITDFTSYPMKLNIASSSDTERLEWICDETEVEWLNRVLSVNLAKAFLDDLDENGKPQSERFIAFEQFRVKTALDGVAFYQYTYGNYFTFSSNRTVTVNNSDAVEKKDIRASLRVSELWWNEGMRYFLELREYIRDKRDVYPEFEDSVFCVSYKGDSIL